MFLLFSLLRFSGSDCPHDTSANSLKTIFGMGELLYVVVASQACRHSAPVRIWCCWVRESVNENMDGWLSTVRSASKNINIVSSNKSASTLWFPFNAALCVAIYCELSATKASISAKRCGILFILRSINIVSSNKSASTLWFPFNAALCVAIYWELSATKASISVKRCCVLFILRRAVPWVAWGRVFVQIAVGSHGLAARMSIPVARASSAKHNIPMTASSFETVWEASIHGSFERQALSECACSVL